MSLSRTLKRRNKVKERVAFCVLCCRVLGKDEDLDLHFKIIHPGVDKEARYDGPWPLSDD